MDADFLALLDEMSPEELASLFQPFQQEQSILDQEMALAGQMRQPGQQRHTPMGALLGGLSNAVGNIGGAALQKQNLGKQTALGGKMQKDATGRIRALLARMQRGQEPTPDIDPAELLE